ncbi:MAG: hypothetical protein ABI824_09805 [Acidobacteriota bacterium]
MRYIFYLSIAASLALSVAQLPAQWIHYPTAGVPKTAKGKPNLKAPAPRTPDGKPDFSGMWWNAGPEQACPEFLGGKNDCAEKGLGLEGQPGGSLPVQARNIAVGIDGGLPYQPWALELFKQRSANSMTDPHVHCLPSGLVRGYTLPHIQKFIQTKGLLAILNEYNAGYRQIFTDGRPLPVDPLPAWNGYSTAKWDRDTLVVQTIGFRDDLWLDLSGNPMTEAAKITERIRRPNFGTLEVSLTVDDPKAYTKPWTVSLNQFLVLDTELIDEVCLENEKSTQHNPVK